MTGFETGIVLRKSPDQINEYSCQKPAISNPEFRKVKELWPSVTGMLKTLQKDDVELHNMLATLDVVIVHLDELVGVFDKDYTGGDFCSGLSFGFNGSNLLFSIAESLVKQSIADMKAKNSK